MSRSPDSPDLAVREIEATQPQLRSDLRWSFQEFKGQGGYLLEDPISGRFFRLGLKEYRFVKSLDGLRTVSQIIAEQASNRDEDTLDSHQAASLLRMLIDSGLTESGDSSHAQRVFDEVNQPRENQRLIGKMGQVLFLRVPLGNPDPFFQFLARHLGWLASPGFFFVWLVILGCGGFSIYEKRERFAAEMAGLFDFGNLWILGILWIVLKLFHECWHGLVCRKFGGAVPEAGVTLLLLTTPLGYVNASSSSAFPSKWQRLAVAGAGMYGELFVAAIAAIFWARIDPSPLGAALHQVVVLSSITTVLFNANPLMRFDGYYMLSDLLDIPNLYSKGQSMSRWLFRRWILGIPKARFPLHPSENSFVIALYGLASGIWRVVVVIGLVAAASHMFEGAGLLIAVFAAGGLVLQGLFGVANYLKKSAAAEGLRPSRLFIRVSLMAGALAAAMIFIKVAPAAKAPAVVRYRSGGEVRAECPGFLMEIVVKNGAHVQAGDLLMRLENVEETSRLKKLEAEIARSRLQADRFLSSDQLASWQAEIENLEALELSYQESKNYVATLEVRSPREGIVNSRQLDSLENTWISPGEILGSVDSPETMELVVMASQEDFDRFEEAWIADQPLEFRPRGRLNSAMATFRDFTARATTQPPHFGLITSGGGPIAVRKRTHPEMGDEVQNADSPGSFEMTKPRFEIHANLICSQSEPLFDGEIGIAVARTLTEENLASLTLRHLKSQLKHLVESRTRS